MKTTQEKLLAEVKKAVKEINPKAEVILFGSRARGDARADSDWDFLILIDGETDLRVEQKYRHRLFDLELTLEEAISTKVRSKSDWEHMKIGVPLYQNIQEEGIRI